MQITFLVGNGFDISCGLRTSYSQFYKWYCKQDKSEKEHVNTFRETIDKDIKAGKKNWADFEEAMGEYTKNFSADSAYNYIDCFEDAHEKLMDYLEAERLRFDDTISEEEIKKQRITLKKFYSELSEQEVRTFDNLYQSNRGASSTISFISFNYTDTLDRYIAEMAKVPLDVWQNTNGHQCTLSISPTVIHAHGRLDEHPIFGVNDEHQIANKELLKTPNFAELLIKPKSVNALGKLWHEEANKLIDKSAIICIYGMSMGYTDATWFEKIMEWLQSDPNRQIIVFWYTDKPSNKRSTWRYLENEAFVRRILTDYSDLTNEKIELIKSRIHVIENTQRVLQLKLKENTDVQKMILCSGNTVASAL